MEGSLVLHFIPVMGQFPFNSVAACQGADEAKFSSCLLVSKRM